MILKKKSLLFSHKSNKTLLTFLANKNEGTMFKKLLIVAIAAIWLFSPQVKAQSAAQMLAAQQKYNFISIPNQSSAFVRMPMRGASIETDAVFHNPAGTARFADGWHLSLNNQALRQKSLIESSYQYYNTNPTEFEGTVSSPIFPSVYLGYKKNRLAISLGINPIAGGGGATFAGLPVVERNTADIIPNLNYAINLTLVDSTKYKEAMQGYRLDYNSEGLALFLSSQINMAYQLNDMLSFSLGVRYVYGQVGFKGHTRDIQINVPDYGGWQSPDEYIYYLRDNAEWTTGFSGGLLNTTAEGLRDSTGTRLIDVMQRGNGFTPIVGLHFSPNEKLNIGIKYEHKTAIEMRTTVNDGKDGRSLQADDITPVEDAVPLFIDGSAEGSDLPAVLAGGITYQVLPKLKLAFGGRYAFVKQADYGGRDTLVNKNYYEIQSALEFQLTEDLLLSGGYTYGNWNVQPEFQTDVDYWLDSHTIAIGAKYKLSEHIHFNIGMLNTTFKSEEYEGTHTPIDAGLFQVASSATTTKYEKNAMVFAIGADIRLGK